MYTKIEDQFWKDGKMMKLSFRARYLMMYLLTSPHRNIICYYFLPKPYACFDLGFSEDEFDLAMKELIDSGRVLYDFGNHVVFVKNYLKYNQLDNKNQVKAALSRVDEIPANDITEGVAAHLDSINKELYNPLIDKLKERLGKGLGERLSKPLPEPLDKPSAKGLLNQITDNSIQIADNSKQDKRAGRACARSMDEPEVSSVFEKFSVIHPVKNQEEADALLDLLDTYGLRWMEKAIEQAADSKGKTVRYVAAILQRWKSTGKEEPWGEARPSAGSKGIMDIIDEMRQGGGEDGEG